MAAGRAREGEVVRLVDAALEATVAGSFTRLGFDARSRIGHWTDPPPQRGRVLIVTGASSGIGRAVAVGLARLGASVWLVGRDRARTADAALEARAAAAVDAAGVAAAAGARVGQRDEPAEIESVVLDVTDAGAVEEFVGSFGERHDHLHGLVHCAGALNATYRQAADATELTVATAVLAPFRLTWLLAPSLRAAGDASLVTVSSGGMYTQRFDLAQLELGPDGYRGTTAYARAKRAQVVLSHEWARRWRSAGVASYAMHPGWVDTPGLHSGLPSFTKLGPLLRNSEQGADTAVWLAAGAARPALEGFYLDRRRRGEHHLPWTRTGASSAEEGARLWAWCERSTGLGGPDDVRAD